MPKHKIFCDFQYDFRETHFVVHALSNVTALKYDAILPYFLWTFVKRLMLHCIKYYHKNYSTIVLETERFDDVDSVVIIINVARQFQN